MKAATVEIGFEKGCAQAEGFLVGSVVQDLLGLKGAVAVMAGDPVAEPLGS
jgi:hypothetical protein